MHTCESMMIPILHAGRTAPTWHDDTERTFSKQICGNEFQKIYQLCQLAIIFDMLPKSAVVITPKFKGNSDPTIFVIFQLR